MESNFGEFKAAFSRLQAMIEERLPKPAEPNHQAQAGQNVDQASSSIRVQPSFGEQLPTTPPSTHRFPIGAEERNAMPMRPPNQDIRLQPNQTRVGVQMGEGMRNGQNRPILGDFGDPIEERRNVGNNARVMPPFQGHFDAPYEEPWLGMRQGRQQGQQGQQAQLEPILGDFGDPIEERRNVGNNARFMPPFQGHFDAPYEEPWLGRRQGRQQVQQGQQAQFEPHAAPPRHEMHFGDPREDQWGLNDQDEARFDPRRGRPARERPRQYQGAHHRDPCWQEQDGPPWNQGRARDPRPMKLDFPRFKGGDPTAWVYRALQYFHYYQVLEPEKFSARPSMQVQRLTPMQMSERRKKGLCYNCDERWSSDHRCKDRKLYVMEEVEDEEAELVEIEEEEVEAELEEAKAEITLCALLGNTSPSTMRVIAIVNGQTTVVLLDTGSTHNFMDGTLAKTLKLPIDGESNFGVRVANGQVIRTLGECKEVKFKMQGLHLKLTFNLLELGGYGIVLGNKVWLQGLKEKPNLIQGSKDFKGKATMKGLLFHIIPCEFASIQEESGAPIRELVEEFPQVFEEPEGLPPKRNHEHQILLKHETSKPEGFSAVEDLLEHKQQVVGLVEHNLVAAQARMKQQADKHRSERKFEVGDWVFLRLQPFRQKSMRKKLGKLSPKFYGPYKVIQRVGMVAYKLELPEGACIHPVFHVSFLKAKLGETITPISRLPPMDALGHLAPQSARILEARTIKKRRLPAVTEVLVQWEGGDPDDATWELLFKLQEDYPHLVGKRDKARGILSVIEAKKKKLHQLECLPKEDYNVNEVNMLRREVNGLVAKEEVMWRQNSRVTWLREGDLNTSYFHACASQRMKTNSINGLRDSVGGWHTNAGEMGSIAVDYFTSLFSTSNPSTIEEVIAPVKQVVCLGYECQVLVNRMKVILPRVISDSQSAFIPGRMITDNIIAFEVIHYLKNLRGGRNVQMATKLDIMNGEPTGYIKPSRGLKQGDPLSPYLFLICAEGFSALIRKAEHDRLIHEVAISRGASFGSPNSAQFEKYLGLPSIIGRAKKKAFNEIKDWIWRRLQGWKEKLLSQAGREILIKAVIQAIPTYAMSVFQFPAGLCADICSMANRFWWGQMGGNRKIHWVGKHKLIKPKLEGGMGFRDIHLFNKALLARQGWRLLQHPDSLIHKLLKAKYFPHTSFLEASVPGGASFVWHSICEANVVLKAGLRWRVGTGSRINIWKDAWLPTPTTHRVLTPIRVLAESATVDCLIDLETMRWDGTLLDAIFLPRDKEIIQAIPLSKRRPVDVDMDRDATRRWIWTGTRRGNFTVRSAYHLQLSNLRSGEASSSDSGASQAVFWKTIWLADVTPKVKNFIWRACLDVLPTQTKLFDKGIVHSLSCRWCEEEAETQARNRLLWEASVVPAEEIVHKGVGMAFDFIELGLHVQDVGGRVEIEDSARDSSGLVIVASTMKMLSVGDSLQAHAMAIMEALQLLFDVGL
uniref:Uncharacterized protein n=1 Tax=Fagus sylvatica TaxID=28930 RepID=A0A2N9FP25_FAGSY